MSEAEAVVQEQLVIRFFAVGNEHFFRWRHISVDEEHRALLTGAEVALQTPCAKVNSTQRACLVAPRPGPPIIDIVS